MSIFGNRVPHHLGALALSVHRHRNGPQPASDLLAADYGLAFTSWADAFHPPTLARVAGAGPGWAPLAHGPRQDLASASIWRTASAIISSMMLRI